MYSVLNQRCKYKIPLTIYLTHMMTQEEYTYVR